LQSSILLQIRHKLFAVSGRDHDRLEETLAKLHVQSIQRQSRGTQWIESVEQVQSLAPAPAPSLQYPDHRQSCRSREQLKHWLADAQPVVIIASVLSILTVAGH